MDEGPTTAMRFHQAGSTAATAYRDGFTERSTPGPATGEERIGSPTTWWLALGATERHSPTRIRELAGRVGLARVPLTMPTSPHVFSGGLEAATVIGAIIVAAVAPSGRAPLRPGATGIASTSTA
jgi:hypothetical protein